jgi:hypothetical protein
MDRIDRLLLAMPWTKRLGAKEKQELEDRVRLSAGDQREVAAALLAYRRLADRSRDSRGRKARIRADRDRSQALQEHFRRRPQSFQ